MFKRIEAARLHVGKYERPESPDVKAWSSPGITLSDPYPLLDPGSYQAICVEATFDWARQWKKWMARLVMEPQNYNGRPYSGRLCKFLSLGKNIDKPHAGQHSSFRQLWVAVNGDQPPGGEVTMQIFEGLLYDITVETVKLDRNGKERQPEHWYSIVRQIHTARARTFQLINTSPVNPSTQATHLTDQHSNTGNTPLTEREQKQEMFLKEQKSDSK